MQFDSVDIQFDGRRRGTEDEEIDVWKRRHSFGGMDETPIAGARKVTDANGN